MLRYIELNMPNSDLSSEPAISWHSGVLEPTEAEGHGEEDSGG